MADFIRVTHNDYDNDLLINTDHIIRVDPRVSDAGIAFTQITVADPNEDGTLSDVPVKENFEQIARLLEARA